MPGTSFVIILVMIKAIITDVSRVLLFPDDENYSDSLNKLYKQESNKPSFRFFNYFKLNSELLGYYRLWHDNDCKMYILTSDVIQDHPELKRHWNGVVDRVFSASKMGTHKSKPEAYQKVLDQIGLSPKEVIYIDDSKENLKAAKEVGLHTVHYKDNEQARFDIEEKLHRN